MSSNDRRTTFARQSRHLSVLLEILVLLTLLTNAIPIALGAPVWYLRLSDAAVNLAPVLLLSVLVLRLSSLFESEANTIRSIHQRSARMTLRWAVIYGLLVPLQVIGFAWLWVNSDNQLSREIRRGETGVAALHSRILASSSEAELRSLVASVNPGRLPPLTAGSLADQKQQLSEAIAFNTSRLSSSLRDQRAAMLRGSLPGTLRVFLGAAIVSAFLVSIRRQLGQRQLL